MHNKRRSPTLWHKTCKNIRRTHGTTVKWSWILNFVIVNHSRSHIEKLRLVDALTYKLLYNSRAHIMMICNLLCYFTFIFLILIIFVLRAKDFFFEERLSAFSFSPPSKVSVSQSNLVPFIFCVSIYKTAMCLKRKHFCGITKKLLCLQ